MTLPNLEPFLPSQVQSTLRNYVLGRLKESRVNIYGEPVYAEVDLRRALEVNNEVTTWLSDASSKAFKLALEDFERECPKGWCNMEQKAYRLINGQRKYLTR